MCGSPDFPALYVDMYSVRRWGVKAMEGELACVLPANEGAIEEYYAALGGDAYKPNVVYEPALFVEAEKAAVQAWKRDYPRGDAGE